jgi:hypothetical protein
MLPTLVVRSGDRGDVVSFWFIGDEEPEDPRFRKAGLAAWGLYDAAGAQCMHEVHNQRERLLPAEWFVPDHFVRSWPNGARAASKLVQVGLWERGDGGYCFKWIRPQNTPDALRANRAKELRKWHEKQAKKRRDALQVIPGGS